MFPNRRNRFPRVTLAVQFAGFVHWLYVYHVWGTESVAWPKRNDGWFLCTNAFRKSSVTEWILYIADVCILFNTDFVSRKRNVRVSERSYIDMLWTKKNPVDNCHHEKSITVEKPFATKLLCKEFPLWRWVQRKWCSINTQNIFLWTVGARTYITSLDDSLNVWSII